jgi:four helix bundle protein
MDAPMAGFENLRVWQQARVLCREVQTVCNAARRSGDYDLGQQLNRASLSVMSNIAEGYLRRSRREFVPFVRIAAGSNAEVRSCLYVARDREYVSPEVFHALVKCSNDIGVMLEGLLRSLTRTRA